MKLSTAQTMLLTLLAFALHQNAASASDNLLPGASFANIGELTGKPRNNGWTWHRIEEPCNVRVADGKAILTGGKVFLHSAEFTINSSTIYDLEFTRSGRGKLSVDILWWKANGLPSSSHRSVLIEAERLKGTAYKTKVTIRAPSDAKTAYIRFAAEQGTVVISSPKLQYAPGKLLLALDAAAPGDQPQKQWQDQSWRNQPFTLKSVRHSAKNNSYIFDKPESVCAGQATDATKFDFETDKVNGAGRGEPFTIVLYAKLDGRSRSGIVNKMEAGKQSGWSIGLEFDEFGLDRISTSQQADNNRRSIGGFPGLAGAGKNVKLNVRDGKFHLYVIHLTGTGLHDGTVYKDGGDKPLSRASWAFGVLSSGSVRNDAPLKIGTFQKDGGFRGEIGFDEIWSGTRLKDRMSPAEYSKYRYNNGNPKRAQ